MGEVVLTAMLCGFLNGGETEIRHVFPNVGETRAILIDCETPTHVIEVGLDRTVSSRDSLHQALFAAYLTGKTPMVILIDTDGEEGRYEYEMRMVTRRADVAYGRCAQGVIERWAATAPFRTIGGDKTLDDLPRTVTARGGCDILAAITDR